MITIDNFLSVQNAQAVMENIKTLQEREQLKQKRNEIL